MAAFDDVITKYSSWNGGYQGNAPTNENEFEQLISDWPNAFNDTPPAWSEVSDKIALQLVHNNRTKEYPNWGAQLDKIYHDGIDRWKTEMVDPVKVKWPKDGSGPIE